MKGWHLAGLWVVGVLLVWRLLRLRATGFRGESTDAGGLTAVSVPLWMVATLLVIGGALVAITIWWFRRGGGAA